jgi:hypothetical protein
MRCELGLTEPQKRDEIAACYVARRQVPFAFIVTRGFWLVAIGSSNTHDNPQ